MKPRALAYRDLRDREMRSTVSTLALPGGGPHRFRKGLDAMAPRSLLGNTVVR